MLHWSMLLVIAVLNSAQTSPSLKSPILSFYSKKELNFSAIVNITSPEELLSISKASNTHVQLISFTNISHIFTCHFNLSRDATCIVTWSYAVRIAKILSVRVYQMIQAPIKLFIRQYKLLFITIPSIYKPITELVSRSTDQVTRQPLIDVPIISAGAYNRDIDKRLARKLVCATRDYYRANYWVLIIRNISALITIFSLLNCSLEVFFQAQVQAWIQAH